MMWLGIQLYQGWFCEGFFIDVQESDVQESDLLMCKILT